MDKQIKASDYRVGDVSSTCPHWGPAVKVTHRKRGKRNDRPIRGAGSGKIRARVIIDYANGMHMLRDPDDVTFVCRKEAKK